jgi:hypothetical protein
MNGQGPAPQGLEQAMAKAMQNAVVKTCACGTNVFMQLYIIKTISALMSPNGMEMTVHQPIFMCLNCKKLLE